MSARQFLSLLAAAFLMAAATPSPAGAGVEHLPRYEAGQTFVFDNGRVEQVRETTGDKVVWAARSGRTYVRSANPIVPILEWKFRGQAGQRTLRGDPDRLWPLRASNAVQFQTVNQTVDEDGRVRRSLHLWKCRAQRPQTITLRTGPMATVPIRCDRFSVGTMRVLERITWWYAEEVGHYVRREARDMRDGVAETITLYATLTPREANPLRVEALAREAARSRGDGD